MTNAIKHFDDIFPTWTNWDRYDNYFFKTNDQSEALGHRDKNSYRWDESDDVYKLDIVMPGMTKEDIDLTFKEGVLTIKCKKQVSEKEQDFLGIRSEQSFRNYPKGVDAERVTAEMKDGVLSIVLPKKETEKPKTISIK